MSGAGGGNGTGTATAGPAGPKPAAGRRFRLTDSTLRDGSHAVAHRFTPEQVSAVVAGLDAAGVPMIEVTHGDGLGGSSFQYGFSGTDERELIAAAVAAAKRARIAVLLLPGIGVAEDLRVAKDLGASLARIATHCTEADISAEHLETAKHLGLETVGFLMMAHMTPPADLARQARLMESYGADCVYVVDSAGHMTPDDVRDRVRALKDALQPGTQVGIHAHNNLSLAIANSLAALEEGVEQVDACTRGLGAGAGNTQTEVMAAVAERLGYETGIDPLAMMDVAEDVVAPIMARPQLIDRATLSLGYAGVYSSFLLHAERAAARFGVDARSILLELGRRRIVGGQEDMIVDVAMELAARRA